jgi:prevent-host-death family protein
MFVLSTNAKGNVAELAIAKEAAKLGLGVLKPLTEHERYDLVLEVGGVLFRVQCKWASLLRAQSVVAVRLSGYRCTTGGCVRSIYTESEVDLVAAYCAELDASYLLPISLVARRRQIHLRLRPPLNAQRACINLAPEYEFPGAVAQLGERVTGSHEVRGSSPLSSTNLDRSTAFDVGAHEFRERFGYYIERAAAGDDVLVRRHGRPLVRLSAAA